MTKNQESQLIRLTQECWARYWQLDVSFMLEYCDEAVSWIGAEQTEFIRGLDAVKENFADLLLHLRSCHLLNQEFFAAECGRNTCAVIGRYLVTTDDENDYFLQVQQRCTFIWEIQKGSPKIIHIHVSNPIGELKIAKGERFVNTVGYMANHYLQENFKRRFSGKQITVTDSRGALRLIYLPEIMYVRAQRNDLILVLATEEVQVKMKISEFMQLADQKFLQVHRSYAVNTDYMAMLERYEISMKNGDRIPVPVKKYNEVRDEMIKRHNAAQSDQSDGVVE